MNFLNGKYDSVLFASSNLLRKLSSYGVNIYFARYFSVTVFGKFSSLYQISSFLIILTNLGFNDYLIVNRDREYIKGNFALVTVFSTLILLCGIFIITPFSLNKGFYFLFILTLLRAFLDTTLNSIVVAYYQVVGKVVELTVVNLFLVIGTAITICFCMLRSFSMKEALGLLIIFSFIPFAYVIFKEAKFKKVTLRTLKALPIQAKDYALSTMTVPLYMTIPNLFASFTLDSQNMAIYQVTLSLGNIVLLTAISIIQSNYVKYLNSTHLLAELKKDVILFIIGFAVILLIWLFWGKTIISILYGKEEFTSVYYWFLMLLFGYLVLCIGAIINVRFILERKQKQIFRINLELILLGCILGLVLFRLGILGIVVSVNIIYLYSFLRRVCYVRNHT